MKLHPRLIDVAKLAGVSIATASVVVNCRVEGNIRVSPDTQKKVWDAVAELGYVPHPIARNLAGGTNRLIGIYTYEAIFPIASEDFLYPLLVGIEREAEAQGYDLILFTSAAEKDGNRTIYNGNMNRLTLADGSILLGLNERKKEVARLKEEGYPFVYIGHRDIPGHPIDFVAADYAQGTQSIIEKMFELGHKKVAYIGSSMINEIGNDREQGFVRAYHHWGYPIDEGLINHIERKEITSEWVSCLLRDQVTGAVAQEGEWAQAVWGAFKIFNISIPKDFSMGILTNTKRNLDITNLDWTCLQIPMHDMGANAVRWLVERLNNPTAIEVRELFLPCKIHWGSTIASPPQMVPRDQEVNRRLQE